MTMTDLNPVDAMTTDYRAMCAELVAAWDALPWEYDFLGNAIGPRDDSAVDRARALLAQPVAEEPTDEELDELYFYIDARHVASWRHYARAVLARWGHPKPPSLKEQALDALEAADGADHPVVATVLTADQHALIRRALESLPD